VEEELVVLVLLVEEEEDGMSVEELDAIVVVDAAWFVAIAVEVRDVLLAWERDVSNADTVEA
jgi:hypothetical protein